MRLPVSFDEAAYYSGEYRGDLIITRGIMYYFPHTRVSASHFSTEIDGADTAEAIGFIGSFFVPIIAIAPHLHTAADKSVKLAEVP